MSPIVPFPVVLTVSSGRIAGAPTQSFRERFGRPARAIVGVLTDTTVTDFSVADGRGVRQLVDDVYLPKDVYLPLRLPVSGNVEPWIEAAVAAGSTVNLILFVEMEPSP